MGKVALTADRPTGKLHLGHYVGSLKNRLELQNNKEFDKVYVMIADGQGLTDNFDNPYKIRNNIIQVIIDYLSIGIDPKKVTLCIQSKLPALSELTFYYLNLVTLPRLERNPTVKNEINLRGFNNEEQGLPVGFLVYPISQAADITAFEANVVPVGEDQKPMLEQTREIVHKFNTIYGETLVMPEIMLPKNKAANRLKGIDGNEKMSKSLNNAIFLSDSKEELEKKVMSMYTDKDHININDKGKVEGNVVFSFLDVFCEERHFNEYLKDYKTLNEMKEHYMRGGLGDVKCKRFLFNILNEFLSDIRNSRKHWENNIKEVYDIIYDGTLKAREVTDNTFNKVSNAMKINYFADKEKMINEWEKYINKI